MVGNLIKLIRLAEKLNVKLPYKTRQSIREDARKPRGEMSGDAANFKKKYGKVPTGLKAGHAYKKRTPNPLSAGGGNTYMVNGKLVTKEAFLKEKGRHDARKRKQRDLRNPTLRSKLKGQRTHTKPAFGGLKKAVKGLTKRRKK